MTELVLLGDRDERFVTHRELEAVRARTDGRVEWTVLDWNRSAIDFYDSLGAHPVDGWTRYRWEPDAR